MVLQQRTKQMIEGFMELHDQGLSVKEIAEYYQLNYSTVYKYLQQIADENGASREKLLERVSSKHQKHGLSKQGVKVETEELLASFEKAEKDLNEAILNLNDTINEIYNSEKENA